MKSKVKKFYNNRNDLQQIHFHLKQTECPHCQSVGNLNLHGYLRGYDENNSSGKIIRGRRIFCSNRGRRKGCGKTFSILASTLLKKLIISAKSFWLFLKNIAKGLNKIKAFKKASPNFSTSSCYRLKKKFHYRQSHIRVLLLKICSPPQINNISSLNKTILHLQTAFKSSLCPIASFQDHFQTSFL